MPAGDKTKRKNNLCPLKTRVAGELLSKFQASVSGEWPDGIPEGATVSSVIERLETIGTEVLRAHCPEKIESYSVIQLATMTFKEIYRRVYHGFIPITYEMQLEIVYLQFTMTIGADSYVEINKIWIGRNAKMAEKAQPIEVNGNAIRYKDRNMQWRDDDHSLHPSRILPSSLEQQQSQSNIISQAMGSSPELLPSGHHTQQGAGGGNGVYVDGVGDMDYSTYLCESPASSLPTSHSQSRLIMSIPFVLDDKVSISNA